MKGQGGICPPWAQGPHSDAAGLFVGPGVKLVEHEEFPVIREQMEKQDDAFLRNWLVPEGGGHRAGVLVAPCGPGGSAELPGGSTALKDPGRPYSPGPASCFCEHHL